MAQNQTAAGGTRLAFGAAIALVLVGVAFVAWVRFGPETPMQEVAAPVAAPAETTAAVAPSEPIDTSPQEQPVLTVDVFRSDADGATLIAGKAEPGSIIKITLDGAPHSEVVETAGEYVAMFEIVPNGTERLIEVAAFDAAGKQLTDTRNFIVAPRDVQIASAPDPESPEITGMDESTAEAQAAADMPVAQSADAPDVLVADADGIRVLQSGAGPNIEAQVVIDTITYDPEGEVQLTGRAPANGFVRVYLDNAPIKSAPIAADGQWKAPLPNVDTGVYTLRVDQMGADGTVTSRTETPFQREDPAALASLAAAQNPAPVEQTQSSASDTPRQTGTKVSRITVQPGNTLWGLASETYGDGMLFVRLFEANKANIRNPDLIYPGQVFALPQE